MQKHLGYPDGKGIAFDVQWRPFTFIINHKSDLKILHSSFFIYTFRSATVEFWPPKPKVLLMAMSAW